jgi:hypothetical protein
MGYWQVSAGYGGESSGGRDYSDVFLDFGVILIGPGEYGEYSENTHRYKQEKDGRQVIRLAEEVEPDDVVALKRPTGRLWEVLAVGVVKSDYVWLPVFDDVEGWDIRHGRRVEWVLPTDGPKKMGGFTRGTLNRVGKAETIEAIDGIRRSGKRRDSRDIPPPAEELSDENLIDNLIDFGLAAEDAEKFMQAVQKIRGLAEWYRDLVRQGVKVKEHETRTFLIVPLLLALGWPEPKLKIEWHNIDIAFFENPYSEETDKCIMILESKKLLESLASRARDQAAAYAAKYPRCKVVVVSDGCSYKLFEREGDNWRFSAYLNILKPRLSHPYRENIRGASDVITSLMGR